VEKINQAREQFENFLKKITQRSRWEFQQGKFFLKKNTQQQVIHHSKGSSHIDV
jgi:hypothetical protein